jgi:hypothetical protein
MNAHDSLFFVVLNDISGNDVAGRQVRTNARAVSLKAQKLIKDREYEAKKKRGSKSNNKITETIESMFSRSWLTGVVGV